MRKLVAADPTISRTVDALLGTTDPRKARWEQVARALDAGLEAAGMKESAGGSEVVVEEALALREAAAKIGGRALPYVVGQLALAGVKSHVLQAALTGEGIHSGRIHKSFQYDGSKKIKVAFFDADGTLRVAPSGKVTANEADDVRILPFVPDRLRRAAEEGYLIAIVSNQAGVAAGHTTLAKADAALQRTAELIRDQGGSVHYTDFAPNKDETYKPNPGMAERLVQTIKQQFGEDVEVDWESSFMVGDAAYTNKETRPDGRLGAAFSDSDRGFAKRLGIRFEEPQDYFGWASFGKDNIDNNGELQEFWRAFTERFANAENRLLAAGDASAIGAYKSFVSSLIRYHNADGRGNGSRNPDVQLAPGVANAEDLKEATCKLAHALATQPFVYHLRQPFIEKRRVEFRRRMAELRAPAVATNTRELFLGLADQIQDLRIRNLTKKAIEIAPREFFVEPSSSSGKHHPPDEINPGGLALHVHRVLVVADWLCKYYGSGKDERDQILSAVLLHDIQKGGRPWKGYAADHGPLAGAWLGKVWANDDDAATQKIRELVSNHMAQWNAPAPAPPADRANQIVSYADYLASQDEIIIATMPNETAELAAASEKIWQEIVADSAEKRVSFWKNKNSKTAEVVTDVPAVLPSRACIRVPQAVASIFEVDPAAPSDSFVLMCKHAITAQFAHVLTPRAAEEREAIHAQLVELQKRGTIAFVPPKENIVDAGSLDGVLRSIAALELGERARDVVGADGGAKEKLHLVSFEVRDRAILDRLAKSMREEPAAFEKLKLTSFVSVFDRAGKLRAMSPGELNEAWIVTENGPRAHAAP